MIETRFLDHALALAEHGSFAVAAQFLGLSQSALSRSIQALESQLEIQLFDRSHRRIEPTDAGQIFLIRAKEIVSRGDSLLTEMGLARQGQSSSFVLAAGPYPAETVVGPVLAAAVKLHPETQFRLRVESWPDAVKLVRAREADLGVAEVSQIADDPELHTEPLGRVQGYLVVRAGHPLLQGSLDPERLLTYPLVSPSRIVPRVLAPLQRQRGPGANDSPLPFPAIHCEPVSIMRRIVAASDAVGMLTLSMFEPELRAGVLVPLAGDFPWLHTNFGVIRLRNRALSLVGESLVECLRNEAGAWIERERRLVAEYIS